LARVRRPAERAITPTAEFLQSECAGSGGLKEVGAVDDLKSGEVGVFA
jgi:hypothetical protein